MANNPGRRKVVAGLAAALVLREGPALAAGQREARLSALRSALLEACGGSAVAAELEHACIGACPDAVLSRTATELAASFERARDGGVSFRHWLREQTAADFAARRVVQAQGWVIAETEFLLFARLRA